MDGRDGAILQIDGVYEILFERHLKHPPHKVWNAITGPGQMSRWFDETHMPDPLAVGAQIRFYHAFGDQWSTGEITRLEPGRLIEWLWRTGFGAATPMSWEITPEPGGCRLVMRQRVDEPAILGRTTAGWHACLDRLQAVVEGAPDPGGMDRWLPLFERYKKDLLAIGITTPQLGAPPKSPPKP
jgi:uncharacterized protein YndB with AHSA1/START domain